MFPKIKTSQNFKRWGKNIKNHFAKNPEKSLGQNYSEKYHGISNYQKKVSFNLTNLTPIYPSALSFNP
jgi:hypothetical protein